MSNYTATCNIIFYNYPDRKVRSLIGRAIEQAKTANAHAQTKRDWEIILKDGDFTRYEATIERDTTYDFLCADYSEFAKPHKPGTKQTSTEYQIIIHDAVESDIEGILDRTHQLGWRLSEDVRITFMEGHGVRADFVIHNNHRSEDLEYLYQVYKKGSESRLLDEVNDCKKQLGELAKSSGTARGLERKRALGKEPAQQFKKGLGEISIRQTGHNFQIAFDTDDSRSKPQLLNAAMKSLNLSGRQMLSGSEFSVQRGKLTLPSSPASSWTIALREIMEQQKERGQARS